MSTGYRIRVRTGHGTRDAVYLTIERTSPSAGCPQGGLVSRAADVVVLPRWPTTLVWRTVDRVAAACDQDGTWPLAG